MFACFFKQQSSLNQPFYKCFRFSVIFFISNLFKSRFQAGLFLGLNTDI